MTLQFSSIQSKKCRPSKCYTPYFQKRRKGNFYLGLKHLVGAIGRVVCIGFISACAYTKPVKSELPLFMEANSSKLYLINTLPTSPSEADVHWCLMASALSGKATQTLHYYLSTWQKKDSVFKWQTHYVPDVPRDETQTFPIATAWRAPDTLTAQWEWELNRTQFKLITSLDKTERSTYTITYPKRDSLPLHCLDQAHAIYAVETMPALFKVKGTHQHGIPVMITISVFNSLDALLQRYKGQTLVWLDAWLPGQGALSFFQVITPSGEVQPIFFKGYQEQTQALVTVLPHSNWMSSTTQKTYPLAFEVELPQVQTTLRIMPKVLNQEINQKQSSFWMGAVSVRDKFSNIELGSGNLYVFSSK